jgi:hypothetical protein
MPQIPIFALSSQGHNLSALGSTFTFRFQTPLRIPTDVNASVSLVSASIWHVAPNLKAGLNNKFVVSFGNINGGADAILEFEPGLYSLEALNASLAILISDLSPSLTGTEIQLIPDNATQKLSISCIAGSTTGDITIRFTSGDFTINEFIGFDTKNDNSDFVCLSTGGDNNIKASNTARFNSLSYYQIACPELAGSGTYNARGEYGSGILGIIIPSTSPGSQLVHNPVNLIKCSSNMAGQAISQCTFQLQDQNGDVIDTRGEEWSAQIIIEF